jgi:sirohydrochlorin ferrochelatase
MTHLVRPALVAVSHGTRDLAGLPVIVDLLGDVRRRLPGVEVVRAWAELVAPVAEEMVSLLAGPAVVVPLLLSSGYHVTTDVPAADALSAAPIHIAAPLGPDRHLARAMTARLREAGALWGDAVVLVAAGSTSPAALADVQQAAALLRSEWGPWVAYACLSGSGPDVSATIEHLRQSGARRVCVAPYLLTPGHLSRKVTELATSAGAEMVAPVLGGHRLLTELVLRRYRQGARALAGSTTYGPMNLTVLP